MFELGRYALLEPLHKDQWSESFIARARGEAAPALFEIHLATPKALQAWSRPQELAPLDLAFTDVIAEDVVRVAELESRPIDFGFEGSSFYTVTPASEGISLRSILERAQGRLSPALACFIAAQLAKSLEPLHRAGLIHAAVAPEKVRIDRRGRVSLLWTALERALLHAAANDDTSTVSQTRGRLHYMSPAQIRFGAGSPPLDAAVDLFALGLIFFELITGRRAHPPQERQAMMSAVAAGVVPSLTLVQPNAPRELEALLDLLLGRGSKRDRPASALAAAASSLGGSESLLAAHLAVAHDVELAEVEAKRKTWMAAAIPAALEKYLPVADRTTLPRRMQQPRIVIQGPRVRRRIGFDLTTRELFSTREFHDREPYRGTLRLVHAGGHWKLANQTGVTFITPDLGAGGGHRSPPGTLASFGTRWAYTSRNTLHLYRTTPRSIGFSIGSIALDAEADPFDLVIDEKRAYVLAHRKRGGTIAIMVCEQDVVNERLTIEATIALPAGLEPVSQWVDPQRGLWRMLARNRANPAAGDQLVSLSIHEPHVAPRVEFAGAFSRVLTARGPGRAFAIATAIGAPQAWLARESADGQLIALARLEGDDGPITVGEQTRAEVIGAELWAVILIDDHFLVYDVEREEIAAYARLPLERDASNRIAQHSMALRPGPLLEARIAKLGAAPAAPGALRKLAIVSSDIVCFADVDEERRAVQASAPVKLPPIGRRRSLAAARSIARIEDGWLLATGDLVWTLGRELAVERGRFFPGLIGAAPSVGGAIICATREVIVELDRRMEETARSKAPFELGELHVCPWTGRVAAVASDRRRLMWGALSAPTAALLSARERIRAVWRDSRGSRWVVLVQDGVEWRAALAGDDGSFARASLRAQRLLSAASEVVASCGAWLAILDPPSGSLVIAVESELSLIEIERFDLAGIARDGDAPVKPSLTVSGSRAYVGLGEAIAVIDAGRAPPETLFRARVSGLGVAGWGPPWVWSLAGVE